MYGALTPLSVVVIAISADGGGFFGSYAVNFPVVALL